MEFLKKYFLLLVPTAAAVIFFVASWLWVSGSLAKLDGEMKASAAKLQTIAQANTREEAVVQQGGAKPVMTAAFPNAVNCAAWEDRYKTIGKELTSLRDKVQQINWGSRKDSLPPTNTLPRMNTGGYGRYKEWYIGKMKELVASLHPTQLPTILEIQSAFTKLKEKNRVDPQLKMGVMSEAGGTPAPGQPAPGGGDDLVVTSPVLVRVRDATDEAMKLTKEAMDQCRMARASVGWIYAELGNLTVSEIFFQDETASEVQLWYAQLEYWVQADVVEAIRQVNDKTATELERQGGGKLTVLNSPVKHLIGITVSNYVLGPSGIVPGPTTAEPAAAQAQHASLPDMSNLAPTASKAKLHRAPYPSNPPLGGGQLGGGIEANPLDDIYMAAGLNLNGVKSPTGRYTNDLYGVVYVTCQVVVDSRKVMEVMDALCKLNLYTILSVRLDPVPDKLREEGYLYGEAPVTLLTFEAELLMFHEYYRAFMPKEIQERLQLLPEPAAGQTAGASGTPTP